jgi:hypothetical protein
MSETKAKLEWRRKLIVRVMLSLLLLVVGFALLDYNYSTPEGIWNAPEIGVEGYSYIEFREGRIEAVTQFSRTPLGSYTKKQGKWFFDGGDGHLYEIRPTWFSMTMLLPDGRPAERSRPRLFLRPRAKVE